MIIHPHNAQMRSRAHKGICAARGLFAGPQPVFRPKRELLVQIMAQRHGQDMAALLRPVHIPIHIGLIGARKKQRFAVLHWGRVIAVFKPDLGAQTG